MLGSSLTAQSSDTFHADRISEGTLSRAGGHLSGRCACARCSAAAIVSCAAKGSLRRRAWGPSRWSERQTARGPVPLSLARRAAQPPMLVVRAQRARYCVRIHAGIVTRCSRAAFGKTFSGRRRRRRSFVSPLLRSSGDRDLLFVREPSARTLHAFRAMFISPPRRKSGGHWNVA